MKAYQKKRVSTLRESKSYELLRSEVIFTYLNDTSEWPFES